MKVRVIRDGLPGEIPKERIREALDSAHVRRQDSGGWEVKTLGMRGSKKTFSSKEEAISYGHQLSHRGVAVHEGGRVRVIRAD